MREWLAHRLVYWPLRGRWGGPPEGEEFWLGPMRAWWLPHPEASRTVLFLHGNAGNLAFPPVRRRRLAAVRRAGASVLAVDYRGYGESPGRPSEGALAEDALLAYEEALRRSGGPERLVVFGRSLGGGVAAGLVSKVPCAGLVLESTFTSLPDVFRHHGRSLGERLVTERYPSLERLRGFPRPVLVIHGTSDWLIPARMGRQLAHELGGEWYPVERAGHNGVEPDGGYVEALARLLSSSWAGCRE